MPVTTEAAVLAKMYDRRQIKGAVVDGPLSFDCAIDLNAAHGKGLKDSPVAGRADALLAPDIETANGIFKSLALYGKTETGGILLGGKVPVALGNRWDSPLTRYHSIVLAVLCCTAG
jgi:phosphate butyryltransferase